ncbi:hypothetical protein L7F22_015037 [Adiantum nelumboides]|nr:hypothetical protein [Adiantum nelumboides]
MLKLEKSPSHSWWWDSHNSPKHSKWLQSNLQDLDDKVKEMLRLIEEDADSFAQRAEMYYQKRPELVNLVEEFYRAYRSLAERYDHLTGEIRQNVPRALQVQYGLSCESPRSTGASGGRHHYSPLRRSNQLFESLLKKACQIDEPAKEANENGNSTQASKDRCNNDHDREQLGCTDVCESNPNSSDEGGLSSSSSDSEVDNLTPLNKLQTEINELKEENKALVQSHEKILERNTALERKVNDLEEGYKAKEEEVNGLKCKLLELNAELVCLLDASRQHQSHASDESHASNVPEKELQVEIVPSLEVTDFSAGEEDTSDELFKSSTLSICEHGYDARVESTPGQRAALLRSLQEEVGILREETREQKLVIFERGEEKREVIRQLSVSLEMLKSENQRLEVVVGLLRKRLHAQNATAFCGVLHSPFAAWSQLFCVGFRARQPSVAVAL